MCLSNLSYSTRMMVVGGVQPLIMFVVICRFVEEHHHEWGERVSGGGEVSPLEAAPRRWRLALANKNTGAFEGWKVQLNFYILD